MGELKSVLGRRKVLSHSMLFAGKMCRSDLADKVKVHVRPAW